MTLDFTAALRALGPNFAARIAQGARVPAEYLGAQFLPERLREDYAVEAANMRIIPTMAGLSGMDSPYAPVGQSKVSTFLEESAKITSDVTLSEKQQRELQRILQRLAANGEGSDGMLQQTLLNFVNVVLRAHWDTAEWLRFQALTTGEIDWRFNGKELKVDYGIPGANKISTATGNNAYGGSTSTFWADLRAAMGRLQWNVGAIVAHTDTLLEIVGNPVNNAEVISQTGNLFTIRRLLGANERPSSDFRETIQIQGYAKLGYAINPEDPTETHEVDLFPKKTILLVGRAEAPVFEVGLNPEDDPESGLPVGYHHVAPTVEGGGSPGRWSRVYTPENYPWQLKAQGVENSLPVIEAPGKVAILTTE